MRILGMGPGVATVGFGLVESDGTGQRMLQCGAITTPKGLSLAEGLVQIGSDLETLLAQFQPDAIAVEELVLDLQHTGLKK